MILLCFLCLASLRASAQVSKETPAKRTAIDGPGTLVLDKEGHLFVAEWDGNTVRRIDLRTKTISTVAGNGKLCCYKEGVRATEASFEFPGALAVDFSGNLFVSDGESVRKVDVHTGLTSTVAGNGRSGDTVDGLPVLSVNFQRITGLAVSAEGEMFIADDIQGKIFKVEGKNRRVFRVAGTGKQGLDGDGGSALSASFRFIASIAVDAAGNLFIADSENCRIRRVDHQTGVIDSIAVTGGPTEGCPPQPGTIGFIPTPDDLAVNASGNVYFVEPAMNVVALVDTNSRTLSLVAGTGAMGFAGDGGPAIKAELSGPSGLAIDSDGNLFISDYRNKRIRRVDARTKVISTIAGNGFPHAIHAEF